MELRGRLFVAAKKAGIRFKTVLVFLLLREIIRGNDDCRAAAACRYLEDQSGYNFMFIHRCIKELVAKKWLTAKIKNRSYTMIALGPAYLQSVTDNVTEVVTANCSKNKHKNDSAVTEDVTGFVTTSSSRLSSFSPEVDVPRSGLKAVVTDTAPPKKARKFKPKTVKPKVPGRRELNDHIVATWQKKTGVKFPNDKAGWVHLDALLDRFPAENLAALWDRFLRNGDPFAAKQGYKLRFFNSAVDGIALNDSSYKRDGDRYFEKWYGRAPVVPQGRDPDDTAPRELPRAAVAVNSPDPLEPVDPAYIAECIARAGLRRPTAKVEPVEEELPV